MAVAEAIAFALTLRPCPLGVLCSSVTVTGETSDGNSNGLGGDLGGAPPAAMSRAEQLLFALLSEAHGKR